MQAKVLLEHLPLDYDHPNSDKNHAPANIVIQRPEPLQETVNAEMVQYLDDAQRKFLEVEVAESVDKKEEYLRDVQLAYNVEADMEAREAAINRIKDEVLRHGSWIGHGDLLTVKMFYTAKSLR